MCKINHIYFFFGFVGWGNKFHQVAMEMLDQGIVSKFSGITFGTGAYKTLREQKDIKYERLDAYETLYSKFLSQPYDEDRIKELEVRYGSLWKYAYADRQLITYHHNQRYANYDLTHKQILNILQGIFNYYEDIVQNFYVDTFLTYATASAWAVIASAVAKHFKCNYLGLITSRCPDRTILTKVENRQIFLATKCNPSYEDRQQAIDYLNEFRNKPTQHSYASIYSVKGKFLENIKRRRSVKISKIFMFLADYLKKPDTPTIDVHDPGNLMAPPLLRIKEWFIFQSRLFFFKKNNSISNKIPIAKFVFFPLHVEPEAATMVLAPFYINIKFLIENIAKALPANYKLCVKEHPNMVGRRPKEYYKNLARIPNVYIVSPDLNSISIIKQSSLVIVVNGTVGLEAALLGKPVITFGSCHFNALTTIRHFNKTINELESYIQEILDTFQTNDKAIVDFLSMIFANSVELNMKRMWRSYAELDKNHMAKEICHLLKIYLETGK